MLTPLEIENKKFKKELIGYSVAEGEEFVQLVRQYIRKTLRTGIR